MYSRELAACQQNMNSRNVAVLLRLLLLLWLRVGHVLREYTTTKACGEFTLLPTLTQQKNNWQYCQQYNDYICKITTSGNTEIKNKNLHFRMNMAASDKYKNISGTVGKLKKFHSKSKYVFKSNNRILLPSENK